MKKLIVLLLIIGCLPVSALGKENKYDRGIIMKTFIPKGQWMVGASFSYSEHVDDNFQFLSVLQDITSDGYTFKVTPVVSYFIRDNISIGGRFAVSRTLTKLDNINLSLGDDLSFEIQDYEDISNTYSGAIFLRTYLNLGDSKRFGLYNEARVMYGYSQSKSTTGKGLDLSGLHQLKHNFNWYDQKEDQVYKGKRTSSSASFKINLLSIDLGIVFYL